MTLSTDPSTFVESVCGHDEPVVGYASATLDLPVTPLTAYTTLAEREDVPYSFLLESGDKIASSDPDGAFRPSTAAADRHARYSFVGHDPAAVISITPTDTTVEVLGDVRLRDLIAIDATDGDVLDRLRTALPAIEPVGFPDPDRQRLTGGLVGYLAYDAVYDLWLDAVGVDRPEGLSIPDAQFVLTTSTLVFDEVADTLTHVQTPIVFPADSPERVYDELERTTAKITEILSTASPPENGGFRPVHERADPRKAYEAAVERAKAHVLDGDIYQGVISRTRELLGEIDPIALYSSLREINPSPYMYLLDYDGLTIVGASPETLVSVRGSVVTSNPIAGTCPRGESPGDDRRLAGEMLADDKERAEHTMLVDLARNDVRRVAEPGSVRVEEFMNVLKYSHVQHIESTVTGTLAPASDAFDATRATFPAGTLSGAPKIRAMEIIHDLESEPRGVYGGGVGYYSWTGDADMAIVIRTATIEHGAAGDDETLDRIVVRAGAGLVADSDPGREYEETERKMDGVLAALARINRTRAAVDR